MRSGRWWRCWPGDIHQPSCRLRMRGVITCRGCWVCDSYHKIDILSFFNNHINKFLLQLLQCLIPLETVLAPLATLVQLHIFTFPVLQSITHQVLRVADVQLAGTFDSDWVWYRCFDEKWVSSMQFELKEEVSIMILFLLDFTYEF